MEETRLQEDARGRREEELRRQEDEIRRQAENDRFQALLQMIVPVATQRNVTATPSDTDLLPSVPTGAASTSTSVPPPQKAKAQNPPPLR